MFRCLGDIKHSWLIAWDWKKPCKTSLFPRKPPVTRRSHLRNASCRCGRCGHPALPPVGVNQKGAGEKPGTKGSPPGSGGLKRWMVFSWSFLNSKLGAFFCCRNWGVESCMAQLLKEKWPKQLGPVYFSKTFFGIPIFAHPDVFWEKKETFPMHFKPRN